MILLVNQHTVPIFVDVANAFAESGKCVTLFTGHIEFGKTPLHPAIRIIRSKSYRRTSSWTRITSWLVFSIHYFFYLLFCERPEHILVVTNPPLAPIITSWMSGLRKLTYSILLYDLYPEALFQAGFTSTRNSVYKIWQRINHAVFAGAEKVITLSESMKNAAIQYLRDKEHKLMVIYNWVDTTYIMPHAKQSNPFVTQFGLQKKKVVLYSGNMGLTHDLESVLEAAAILKNDTRVMFVLIGEGGKSQKLHHLKNEKLLHNVLLLPYQDAAMFPFSMSAGDIGIVTLGKGAEGISVPSKTYINMAAGLCLIAIAPEDSELTRLISTYQIGINVTPGQPAQLAEQLLFLLDNPQTMMRYQEKSRNSSFLFSPDNAFLYVKAISPQ